MTSLRGSLPPSGSTLWQKDRRSSSVERSQGPPSLITHVVIREVWKKSVPSPHAMYKIDVMTKSNHWFVLKRYQEFSNLHKLLVTSYGIPKDMLPPKKLTSKMSLKHLERRRDALEHYLQRLVNSSTYVSSSPEILNFLDVGSHDVMSVTKSLARELLNTADKILADGGSYTFTLTQLYCITRQLQLPEPVHDQGESPLDLGHLYSFVYHLEDLCVVSSKSENSQELASHLEFDISLFKALRSLRIDSCPVRLIKGLPSLQSQLKYLAVRYSLKTMRELLVDQVVEKRKASSTGRSVAGWRSHATAKLTQNRVILQPWVQLTNLNLSHNQLSKFDEAMNLMPALQSLDLKHNEFVSLDLFQLDCPSLTHLDLSHNSILRISGTPSNLNNLKSLVVSYNNLEKLSGLESLVGLIELDIANNQIGSFNEVSSLSGMTQLRYLSVDGNPFTKIKLYRVQIFSFFKGRKVVLDNKLRTSEETASLSAWPSRSRSQTSPESFDREGPGNMVRLVRAHSYDVLGSSLGSDDLDISNDDDDSGIEGYTPSATSMDVSVDAAEASNHGDLEFNWSFYDFLDNNFEPSDVSTLASQSSANDLEEQASEDMCDVRTDRSSSTELASEVSVNEDNSQLENNQLGSNQLESN